MKTINLLPRQRQQELRYEEVFRGILVLIWLSIASFGLVFASQVGTKVYLENRSRTVKSKIEQIKNQVTKEENEKIRQEIKVINNVITDYNNLSDSSPKWSKVLKAFAALPPEGIVINSFSGDVTKKTVTIQGYSPTREQVLQLYDNIRKDENNFHNVNYPLENLIKPKEVNFHFTFFIKDELLR